MGKRRRTLWVGIILLLLLAVFILATRGLEPPAPNPPGTFSFAALGDAPYYLWEDLRYRLVLQDLDAHDLGFVLHVGDLFWRPCTDEMYRRSLGWFNGLRHPVIYTPGDNEWTDCWGAGSGGYEPLDRLARVREIFFKDPTRSAGGRSLPLTSQGGSGGPFSEFVENARWNRDGIVFFTVDLPGSRNALEAFPARTPADDAAAKRRTEAATAWTRESFAAAKAANATAVVLAFHAEPGLRQPAGDAYRSAYEPFLATLEEETARFGRPVLLVHGDDHEYTVDHPLVQRTTGRRLENLTRLEVPGSPDVGWVRVVVRPGAENPFSFEERVVPAWKYW